MTTADLYWPRLSQLLSVLDLGERQQLSARLTAAEGAAQLLHVTDMGSRPPAAVDVVPYCIDREAWSSLVAGLAQRVRLNSAILDDLYGEQVLLQRGVIPPELVYSDPRYSRACRTIRPRPRRLLLQSTELVRDSLGEFLAVGSRVDVAAGIGDALLARSIASRTMPEAVDLLRPHGHASWLHAVRDALSTLASDRRRSPRVVVLTNGAEDRDYLEYAYLAMTLGYHLVEPEDLIVRDGRVWLRSLGQLEPVDVIFRSMPSIQCDPLEFEGEVGVPGVPGLALCARQGTVGVANAFGSAIVEHAAFADYLDVACATLLEQDLLLHSGPAFWLGVREHYSYTTSRFEEFVFVEVLDSGRERIYDGRLLDDRRATELFTAIRQNPYRFSARAHLDSAPVPGFVGRAVEPVDVTLRLITLDMGDATAVMPGGVAYVNDQRTVKDVWVIAPGMRGAPVTVGEPLPQIDLRGSVPTRSAESLFWLGRNAERAEMIARAMNSIATRVDDQGAGAAGIWLPSALDGLLSLARLSSSRPLGSVTGIPELWPALAESVDGLCACIEGAVNSARAGRAYLSQTAWRVIGRLQRSGQALEGSADRQQMYVLTESLDDLLLDFAALAGASMESVVRGPGWMFWDLGRRIDRALLTLAFTEILLRPAITPQTQIVAEIALAGCESLVAYRRRYRSDMRADAIIDLLVRDTTNPRSVAFQIDRMREHDAALPAGVSDLRIRLLDAAEAVARMSDDVDDIVPRIRGPLLTYADQLVERWFSHADTRGALVGRR